MQALAVLLALAGAACLYLAAPNQVLCVDANDTGRMPRLFCGLGLALGLASACTMSVPEGWPAAIVATLITLTCSLSAWPFIGVWTRRMRTADARGDAPHRDRRPD